MKAKELKELSNEELQAKLKELDLQLFNHRFNARLGSLEKPVVISHTRKDIARVKTILGERGVNV